MSANGDLYIGTTVSFPSVIVGRDRPFRTYWITAANTVQTLPYNTDIAFTPNGNAYLVSSSFGVNTLQVIDAQGHSRLTALPFGSDPSAPIVGQDGNVYVLAGVSSLGADNTRVYTFTGTTTTTRTVLGAPGDTVATPDGLVLETFSDKASGTTYISRVTTTDIVTSAAIGGRIGGLQVNPDGVVYAPIADLSLDNTPVAVVDSDGNVSTLTLPGKLATTAPRVNGGAAQGSETVGYVNYAVSGQEYVAVINPDATVARTLTLPESASGGTVFYGPDGVAHELLVYRDASGQSISRQILTPSTTAYTAILTGQSTPGEDDVIFSPNGTGYLLIAARYRALPDGNQRYERFALGFASDGTTVFDDPDFVLGSTQLAFDENGTAYAGGTPTSTGIDGLYVLTPSGRQLVAVAGLPTFGPDGTGYALSSVGTMDDPGTVVTTFAPLTVV